MVDCFSLLFKWHLFFYFSLTIGEISKCYCKSYCNCELHIKINLDLNYNGRVDKKETNFQRNPQKADIIIF